MITHVFETVPHANQRYETVGDWYYLGREKQQIVITSSSLPDPRMELLVKFHELIEQSLCRQRGIREEDVTRFDENYEANRKEGDFTEPGDDYKSPYYREHKFATKLEKEFAKELGVNWDEYEEAINSL